MKEYLRVVIAMLSSLPAAEATELLVAEFLSYFPASTDIKEQQQTTAQDYEAFSFPSGDHGLYFASKPSIAAWSAANHIMCLSVDIFSFLNISDDDEGPPILPQSLTTYEIPESIPATVNARGLNEEIVTSPVPLTPYELSSNNLTNKYMKTESNKSKSSMSSPQELLAQEQINNFAPRSSSPPSSSSSSFPGANKVGTTLKEAASPSKIVKKFGERQKKSKRAQGLANLGQTTDEVCPEPLTIVSSNTLPVVTVDAVPPSTPVVEDQKVTIIQSMCKAATAKDLSASEALFVKQVGDGALFMDFQAFSKIVGGSLQMDERMLCSFNIPTHLFASSQAACEEYFKVLRPSRDRKWKPNTPAEEIRQRIIQVLLHLSCEELVREIEEKESSGILVIPDRKKRNNRTIAHDWILKATYGDQNPKEVRKHISEECRWGDRWWRLASRDGLGILLLASKFLAKYMYYPLPPFLTWFSKPCSSLE